MKAENRNTVVVASLILAMTAGARVLLWLESGPPSAEAFTPIAATATAADGSPVEEVIISCLRPGEIDLQVADCLIWPDGHCEWQARGTHILMVVVGLEDPEATMTEVQKKHTLLALGSMTQARGWDLVPVRLDPYSDTRRDATLPRQASDLCDLLVSKGIIE
ncbi:MAG: hypothetical protein ABIG44_16550 [Planctomycetota bacterium]